MTNCSRPVVGAALIGLFAIAMTTQAPRPALADSVYVYTLDAVTNDFEAGRLFGTITVDATTADVIAADVTNNLDEPWISVSSVIPGDNGYTGPSPNQTAIDLVSAGGSNLWLTIEAPSIASLVALAGGKGDSVGISPDTYYVDTKEINTSEPAFFVDVGSLAFDHATSSSPSVAPIPASLPLFATGLILFGFINYYRKRRKAVALAVG